MQLTHALRLKYAPKPTNSGRTRKPPGADDVLRLCSLCDRLEYIAREAQHMLDNHGIKNGQGEIERMLWMADRMEKHARNGGVK